MPDNGLWCYCGIYCPIPKYVTRSTWSRHRKAIAEYGGTLVPANAPSPGENEAAAVFKEILLRNRRLVVAAEEGQARKRGNPGDTASGRSSKQRRSTSNSAEGAEAHGEDGELLGSGTQVCLIRVEPLGCPGLNNVAVL